MLSKDKIGRSQVWTLARLALLALLAQGASLPLAAAGQAYLKRGEPQQEGRNWVEVSECGALVPESGRLILRADVGSVSVAVGPPERLACQVRLTAYTGDRAEAAHIFRGMDLNLRQSGRLAILTARDISARRRGSRVSVEFNLNVPRRFNLDLETHGGDVEVVALDGELRATTAGGDIRAGDVNGPVHLETAGGNITVRNVGQRLDARTAGGNVHVGDVNGNANIETSGGEIYAGTIQGGFHARTAGGDIVLRGASGPVVAETAGGQIQMGDCGATVRAETAGGNIRLQGAGGMVKAETAGGGIALFRLRSGVQAETAAGTIFAEIDANREGFATSDLGTSVGDIQVFLPPNLPLNIEAVIEQAGGHRISTDFPLTIQGQGQGEAAKWPLRTVHGECALNGGGKPLKLHTTMGNIEIRKLDSTALIQLRLRQESYWKSWEARQEQRLEEMIRRLQQRQQEQLQFQQKLLEEQGKQLRDIQKQPQPSDDD